MRILGFFLSLLLVLQLTCFPQAVFAADATYSQSSGIQAQVPVNKIGALLLVDAVAFLSGDSVEVQGKVKGQDGPKQTLLTGTLTERSISGSGGSRSIHGKVLFNGGPSLPDLGKAKTFEIEVPLTGCAGTTTVSGQCSHMSFTPSATHQPVATKPTKTDTKISHPSEHSTAKKIIVSCICLGLIATAITVPIVVCAITRRHHHKNNNNGMALAQYIWAKQHTPVPVVSTPKPSGHWH